MRLECAKCGLYLGDLEKGKVRKGSVSLCDHCWRRAESAVEMADMVARTNDEMPGFLKGLFGGKDGKGF